MELVSEVVKTTILTGKLSNPGLAPVSILLIAPPEHGKTSILVREQCEPLLLLNDLTGTGLRQIAAKMTNVTHIALLDMLMLTAHATKANRFLMANVAAMTEEGFMGEATPDGIHLHEKPIRKAFICCMTSHMVQDGRNFWNKSGITSRLFPFFYSYGGEQTEAIRDSISTPYNGRSSMVEVVVDLKGFKVPKVEIFVKLSRKWNDEIELLARKKSIELGEEVDPKGFRRLKQFRSLACAHALLRTWKGPEVGQRDVDFLRRIFKYVSYSRSSEL